MDPVDNFLAVGLLILCCFVIGWAGAGLKTWALRRKTLDLDYRLTDLEGRLSREQKIRAGKESLGKKNADHDLENWALEQTKTTQPAETSSFPSFPSWWRGHMKGGK